MKGLILAVLLIFVPVLGFANHQQNLRGRIQNLRQNFQNQRQQNVVVEKVIVRQQQQQHHHVPRVVERVQFKEVKGLEFIEDNYGRQFVVQKNVAKQAHPTKIIERSFIVVEKQNYNYVQRQNICY